MNVKTTLTAIAAIAALGLAAGAHAGQTSPDAVTIKVSMADLNLSTEAGARAALDRIGHAARSICGDRPDNRELGRQSAYGSCLTEVTQGAVASLHNPYVTALDSKGAQSRAVLASAKP